jgi:hypothetical protein
MEMLLLLNTKGTTNTNPCGRTSIGNSQKYRWQPDADAPETNWLYYG